MNDRDVNYFLDLDNLRDHYDFLDYFLYNLGHFDDLFNHSRNNDNPLNNFFNLNDLWNFNQLLYDLLNDSRDSFDSLNNFLNRNYSFLDYSNNLRLLYKVIYNFLYFLYSVLVKDLRLLNFNFLMDDSFNHLNHWLLNDFSLHFYHFMD